MQGENLLGIAQAAKIIGMHPMTLGKMVRQGAIPGRKTENGHWVIVESEVARFAAIRRAAKDPEQMPECPLDACYQSPFMRYGSICLLLMRAPTAGRAARLCAQKPAGKTRARAAKG
jgi:hypothetical protein